MIDFHAHIDLYPDPFGVVKECIAKDIHVLSVTTTPSAWEGTSALAEPGSRVYTALGLHPQIANQRKGELYVFDNHLPNTPYVGEIGLDAAPGFKKHWDDQIAVFDHILQSCTRVGGRIMSIHSRRAASAVLDRLETFPDAGVPILHWFSGNRRELDRAISLGCWFSVGSTMLIPTKSRDLVSYMPRERVLTETDGPFAQVNGQNAMPWDVWLAASQLAILWKTTLGEVEQILYSNLSRVVSLL